MPSSSPTMLKKEIAWLIVILACLAGSMFAVFNFLAQVEVGMVAGVMLFLIAAGLLIVGYMVGLLFLAIVGVSLLQVRRARVKGTGEASARVWARGECSNIIPFVYDPLISGRA